MEKRERIGPMTAAFMILVALIFDLVQGLLLLVLVGLFVNWIISLIAGLTFYLWFKIRGVNFSDGAMKKPLALFGGALFETLPLFNVLPGWTVSTILMIAIVRNEDARYNKKVTENRSLAPHPST